MCLIVHKPKGIEFKEEHIKATHQSNKDGFGFMYFNPETKKIHIEKFINQKIEEIVKIIQEHKDLDVVYHFRLRTHGEICPLNSHPYPINYNTPLDIDSNTSMVLETDHAFVHNGMISGVPTSAKFSDTYLFNETIVEPLVKDFGIEALNNSSIKKLIEKFIGGSKLIVMSLDGDTYKMSFFNEDSFSEFEGLKISNTNSFGGKYPMYTHPSTYINRGKGKAQPYSWQREHYGDWYDSFETKPQNRYGLRKSVWIPKGKFLLTDDSCFAWYHTETYEYLGITDQVTSIFEQGFWLMNPKTNKEVYFVNDLLRNNYSKVFIIPVKLKKDLISNNTTNNSAGNDANNNTYNALPLYQR